MSTAEQLTSQPDGDETPSVLVVGEAVIDIVDMEGQVTSHVGGSPANVALGLGRLGCSVTLLTQIGDDRPGDLIRAHLAESHVILGATSAPRRSSTATARIQPDGHAIYEFDIAWEAFQAPALPPPRIIHTGSVATFLEPGATVVRDLLRDHEGTQITFDPNIRPALVGPRANAVRVFEETARLCDVVKMSDEDADFLYPGADVDDVLDTVISLGAQLAVMTRGADGAVLATERDRVQVGSPPVKVVDTIGAGDTFMASLINSLLAQTTLGADQLTQMGREAAHLASMTVSRVGADLPWARETVRQDFHPNNGSPGTFLPVKEN